MTATREESEGLGPRKRRWPSVLLLLVTLALLWAAGEAACRLAESLLMGLRWDWRDTCVPADEPALIYRLAPNSETEVAGVPFRTNADGFRDRAFPDKLSPKELRVVVLGDSLVAGFGVADEEAFPRLLERSAAGLVRSGPGPRVLNLGVPGYNLEQTAAMAELCIARYRPRLVLLCLFINDLEKPFLTVGDDGSLGMPQAGLASKPGISPRGWLRANSYFYRFLGTNWDRILRRIGVRPDEATDQRRRYARLWSDPGQQQRLERVLLRAREVVSDSGEHRKLVVVLLPALIQLVAGDPGDDPVRPAVERACERLGLPLVDLLTPLEGEARPERFYLHNDPHPSPEGHRRFAELIATGLIREGLMPLPRAGRGRWSTPHRVTATPGNSHTAALHDRSMAFDSDGRGHLVWFDASDYAGTTADARASADQKDERLVYEIYHSVLDDRRWSRPRRLSPRDGRTSRTPDILADGNGRITLVYTDERTGTMGIYTRSLAAGSWGPDRRISPEDLVAYKASFCIDGQGRGHAAFPGQLDDRREIFHVRFDPAPSSAAEPVGQTPAGGRCFFPGLVADGVDDSLHLAWKLTPAEGPAGVFHRRFADGEWGPVTRLTPEDSVAGQPATWPASGGGQHLVWVDHRHGQPEIYYARVGGDGNAGEERVTWHHPSGRTYEIRHPSVAEDGSGAPHLVWTDSAVGNLEVYHKHRGPRGWSATTRITRDGAVSMDASIYPAPDGTLHVVWDDERDGNFEIYHSMLTPVAP